MTSLASWRRRTKIVCTLGPATSTPAALRGLRQAGMNIARLNFSHGDHDQHAERIRLIRQLREETGRPIALLQDLSGPKIRIGAVAVGEVCLRRGQTFTLTTRPVPGDAACVQVSMPEILRALVPKCRVFIDDGLIELQVLSRDEEEALTRVVTGGVISSHKGLVVPGVDLDLPSLTEKDRQDLRFGLDQGVDWVAASFLRTPEDVLVVKRAIQDLGHSTPVIAKIETGAAVRNIDGILAAADGAMVARGDLGVELPVHLVPGIQKSIIRKCNRLGKPVITATQMLDSMMRNPRPTRAEVTDVANAVLDGTDCVMLSGETAAGRYPLDAVRMMSRIVLEAESKLNHDALLYQRHGEDAETVTDAISQAAAELARDLGAKAILAATSTGYTARMVSRYRPKVPIIGVTSCERVYRQLQLVWGVRPWLSPPARDTDETIQRAVEVATQSGLVKAGDMVVITAGIPSGISGHTNLIKVQTL
ncbi:MAG TPA: pyruvate kinase [Armatimonadota bacterium]|jgi:pyruvate kinase